MSKLPQNLPYEVYAFGAEMSQLFSRAVAEARTENHRLGIANFYLLNGVLFGQLPDGALHILGHPDQLTP
jgi:hypothetical protein